VDEEELRKFNQDAYDKQVAEARAKGEERRAERQARADAGEEMTEDDIEDEAWYQRHFGSGKDGTSAGAQGPSKPTP
jgi:hypothetical protein